MPHVCGSWSTYTYRALIRAHHILPNRVDNQKFNQAFGNTCHFFDKSVFVDGAVNLMQHVFIFQAVK